MTGLAELAQRIGALGDRGAGLLGCLEGQVVENQAVALAARLRDADRGDDRHGDPGDRDHRGSQEDCVGPHGRRGAAGDQARGDFDVSGGGDFGRNPPHL